MLGQLPASREGPVTHTLDGRALTHTLCLARQFTIGQLLRQHWPRPAKLTTCLILDCRRCSSPIYEANPNLICLRNKLLGSGAPSWTPKLFLTPQLCLCRDGLTAPPTPSSAPWSPPSLPSKSFFPAFLTLGQCPAFLTPQSSLARSSRSTSTCGTPQPLQIMLRALPPHAM